MCHVAKNTVELCYDFVFSCFPKYRVSLWYYFINFSLARVAKKFSFEFWVLDFGLMTFFFIFLLL